MKLEVGMYVRTGKETSCRIGKIKFVNTRTFNDKHRDYYSVWFNKKEWCEVLEIDKDIKASHNIIDLIEVGDYVNGHLVFDRCPDAVYIEDANWQGAHRPYCRCDISEILTKELMEENKYVVE